jgi:peroxiredoxin Q/BCP
MLLSSAGQRAQIMNEKNGPIPVGSPAPGFVLPGRFGRLVSLAEFRGKKNVLVYFYPKDDTPGCTKEACSLRDAWKELKARDVEVLGISRDSLVSHDAFASKYQLPFELLSDPEHSVHEAWGAWGETKWGVGPLRRSFLVGKDGRVLHVFEKVDTEHHAEEVLKAMESSVPPGTPPPAPEQKPAAPGSSAEAVEKAAEALQFAASEVAREARKKVEAAARVVAKKAETAGKAVKKAARKVARKVAKKAAPKKKAVKKAARKVAKKAAPKKKAVKRAARKVAKKAAPLKKAVKKAARKTARKAKRVSRR